MQSKKPNLLTLGKSLSINHDFLDFYTRGQTPVRKIWKDTLYKYWKSCLLHNKNNTTKYHSPFLQWRASSGDFPLHWVPFLVFTAGLKNGSLSVQLSSHCDGSRSGRPHWKVTWYKIHKRRMEQRQTSKEHEMWAFDRWCFIILTTHHMNMNLPPPGAVLSPSKIAFFSGVIPRIGSPSWRTTATNAANWIMSALDILAHCNRSLIPWFQWRE